MEESTVSTSGETSGEMLANARDHDPLIGTVVAARYKLLGMLGEGGFGVVYEAEQLEPVRRRVALKVIKPGMDSRMVLARFEAERQALAVMEHPGIAKVLDGGVTHRGLPFFVMELVRGEPITTFCDRHRLTIDQRVELAIAVAKAIQHAHAKGVIHRDLKPSNILVGYDAQGAPQPRVIDFGVAKALNQRLSEQTIFTDRGQMIGTPEYMSPEQAEMAGTDIDTRADVYSLGVVLYELLTGARPFDLKGVAIAEILRVIRETPPMRPSTRVASRDMLISGSSDRPPQNSISSSRVAARRLRRDLDWVIMKCLEKQRDQRYATAEALAVDLEAFLKGEKVLAGPPSLRRSASRFVRNNQTILSVLVLVSATAATGFVWPRDDTADSLDIRHSLLYIVFLIVFLGITAYALAAERNIRRLQAQINQYRGMIGANEIEDVDTVDIRDWKNVIFVASCIFIFFVLVSIVVYWLYRRIATGIDEF